MKIRQAKKVLGRVMKGESVPLHRVCEASSRMCHVSRQYKRNRRTSPENRMIDNAVLASHPPVVA